MRYDVYATVKREVLSQGKPFYFFHGSNRVLSRIVTPSRFFLFLSFLPAGHYTYDRYLFAAADRANFPASNKLVGILRMLRASEHPISRVRRRLLSESPVKIFTSAVLQDVRDGGLA